MRQKQKELTAYEYFTVVRVIVGMILVLTMCINL